MSLRQFQKIHTGDNNLDRVQQNVADAVAAIVAQLNNALPSSLQPIGASRTSIVLASATPVVLTSAQYNCPLIALTGTLTALVTLVFPNVSGQWDLDVTSLSTSGAGGLQVKSGSQTVQILHSTPDVTAIRILTSGSNTVGSSYFN